MQASLGPYYTKQNIGHLCFLYMMWAARFALPRPLVKILLVWLFYIEIFLYTLYNCKFIVGFWIIHLEVHEIIHLLTGSKGTWTYRSLWHKNWVKGWFRFDILNIEVVQQLFKCIPVFNCIGKKSTEKLILLVIK